MSAVVTAAASAAAPEFKPATKQAFTGSTGTLTIETGTGKTITCSKGTSSGEITGASTVGGLVLTLTGCATTEGSGCKFHSENAKNAGEIITNALVGTLGEVKTAEAASGVGLLLEPASGKVLTTIQGPCLLGTSRLEGSVAAEVASIKTLAKTAKLAFVGKTGKQHIKFITIKGVEKKSGLKFEGGSLVGEISWDTTETLTFNGNEVEIT
jgi:hypothetical protein